MKTPNYMLAEKIFARLEEWKEQGVRVHPADIYLILQAEGAPMTRDTIIEELHAVAVVSIGKPFEPLLPGITEPRP